MPAEEETTKDTNNTKKDARGLCLMAARITIFCHKSVGQVTAEELFAGVKSADLRTIAEGLDVPDDLIDDALAHLRIEDIGGTGEFRTFILYYGREPSYQCRIERWTKPDSVAVIEERNGMVADFDPAIASEIRKRIQGTEEIVFVQFGSAPGMKMAPALASEVARWVAEQGGGIIEGADRTWWELGNWQEYQPLTP